MDLETKNDSAGEDQQQYAGLDWTEQVNGSQPATI